jgi:uncharacterized cupin superfamily protein
MTDEAPLERTEYGLTPSSEGWFSVNLRDAAWMTNESFGAACVIEGDAVSFSGLGYTIAVLAPGRPNGLYHHEDEQEDFLVLSGECLAIIEGVQRPLRAWDFVHCPPGTRHIFVGAGDGPCVIFMAGSREHGRTAVYPDDELARRHGAAARAQDAAAGTPYAPYPRWQPGPPETFEGTPFG